MGLSGFTSDPRWTPAGGAFNRILLQIRYFIQHFLALAPVCHTVAAISETGPQASATIRTRAADSFDQQKRAAEAQGAEERQGRRGTARGKNTSASHHDEEYGPPWQGVLLMTLVGLVGVIMASVLGHAVVHAFVIGIAPPALAVFEAVGFAVILHVAYGHRSHLAPTRDTGQQQENRHGPHACPAEGKNK